jgi:hypothetical protein
VGLGLIPIETSRTFTEDAMALGVCCIRFIRRKHRCSRNCLSALAGALMFGAALLPDGHISFVSDVARTRRGTGTVLAGWPGDIRIKRDFHDDLILRFPLIAPLAAL